MLEKRKNMSRAFSLVLLLVLQSGCVLRPPATERLIAPAVQAESCQATNYALQLSQMSKELQATELTRVDTELDKQAGYCAALKLAIVLSSPSSRYQDDTRAIRLFQKLLAQTLAADDKVFIDNVLPHIQQRERIRQLFRGNCSNKAEETTHSGPE